MTPQEFKSWFDGFTEALTGVPTKAQWARIKDRVGEIDGKAVTERVFVDRYYPTYPPIYWHRYGLYGSGVCNSYSANAVGALNAMGQNATLACNDGGTEFRDQYRQATSFNSVNAMADLGRADAEALKN